MVIRKIKATIRNNDFLNCLVNFVDPHLPIFRCPNGKFIFIRLHKVGGTSVANALGIKGKAHFTTKEAIKNIGSYHWKNNYKFAFVRNPFSKMVSAYNYFTLSNRYSMGENPIPFKEWIKKTLGKEKELQYFFSHRWFQQQCDWLKDSNGMITLNKIGRFENIHDDFQEISSILGFNSPLPHLNKSKKADYRTFYDDESFEIVRAWHEDDLSYFGYTFDNG